MSESRSSARDIDVRRETISSTAANHLIRALNVELSRRYPEDGTEKHFRLGAEELSPGRGAFLIAYAGATPIACGAVRLLDEDTAEIKRMYVAPGARGRGLGRRLLGALEAEGRRLGVTRLVLETGPRQPESIALYSSAGFSRIGAFGEYEESSSSLFMGKDV